MPIPFFDKEQLRYFPITLFAATMGLAGFTLVLQRAGRVWGFHPALGHTALALTALVFLAFVVLYAVKIRAFRAEVAQELGNPVKLNLFAGLTVSTVLLSAAFLEVSPATSYYAWIAGTIGHLALTLYIMGRWLNGASLEIPQLTPLAFIPVVGNILIPLAGVSHGARELSWFFFSVGAVFWLVLFTILVYRLIFHAILPERLLPTLFILIAPPAAGFVAYLRLNGVVDSFARVLLYVGLFLTLLLAVQARRFLRLKFALPAWAYSFPLAAMTLATLLMYEHTRHEWMKSIALVLFLVLAAIVAWLVVRTVQAAGKNELLVPEG